MRSLLCILLITAVGCETVVDVDAPAHESRLVATAIFTPDSVWSVTLHRSLSLSQPGSVHEHVVDGASVTIQEQGDDTPISLVNLGGGVYRPIADLRPTAGKRYRMRAEASGLPAITAEATTPADVDVTIASMEKQERNFGASNRVEYRMRIRLADPPGTSFYGLNLVEESTDVYEGEEVIFERYFQSADPSLHQFFDEAADPNPVDDVLAGEGEGEVAYYGAIMTDRLFDGKVYEFGISTQRLPAEHGALYLQISTFGPDYFDYQYTVRSGDPNPFVQPVQLYTNIEGGYGIFAGYTTKTLEIAASGE